MPSRRSDARSDASIEARAIDGLRVTQTRLAEMAVRSHSAISLYRSGKLRMPKDVRRRLATLLATRSVYLAQLAADLDAEADFNHGENGGATDQS